jgi:hypothetical protein
VAWCAERGVRLEPFGVDLSPGLAAEARRLPRWADGIWVGNALDWTAPGGPDGADGPPPAGPPGRPGRAAAGQQLRAGAGDRSRHADQLLRPLGFRVDGVTHPTQLPGRPHPPSAWVRRDLEPPS